MSVDIVRKNLDGCQKVIIILGKKNNMENLDLLVILAVVGTLIIVPTMLVGKFRHEKGKSDYKEWLMASYFGVGILASVIVLLFNEL